MLKSPEEGLGKSPENFVSAKIFHKNIKNIFLHISLVNQILQLIFGGMLRFLNPCLLQLFDMKLKGKFGLVDALSCPGPALLAFHSMWFYNRGKLTSPTDISKCANQKRIGACNKRSFCFAREKFE